MTRDDNQQRIFINWLRWTDLACAVVENNMYMSSGGPRGEEAERGTLPFNVPKIIQFINVRCQWHLFLTGLWHFIKAIYVFNGNLYYDSAAVC